MAASFIILEFDESSEKNRDIFLKLNKNEFT